VKVFPPTVVFSSTSSPVPWTLSGCPVIQLSSDTVYLELASDPTVKGVQLHQAAPTSDASLKSEPLVLPTDQLYITFSGLPLRFSNLLEWLTELRKTLDLHCWSIMKDTAQEQPKGRDA